MKFYMNYFGENDRVSNVKEAISFVNSLSYRGSGHSLECSENAKKTLEAFIKNPNSTRQEFKTTGCSTSYICITHKKNNKEIKAKTKAIKEAKEQNRIAEMSKEKKGDYDVVIPVTLTAPSGVNFIKELFYVVNATSKMHAYLKVEELIREKGVFGHSFIYHIPEANKAVIDFK